MEVEKMLDRVIIIDNIEEEITGLVSILEKYDIAVDSHIIGDDYSSLPVYERNRQLVFMDLMFDEDESHLKTNISRVIQILSHIIGPSFGPYGLVIWTKHEDRVKDLLKRLSSASQSVSNNNDGEKNEEEITVESHLNNPPLFAIGIDKIQFKRTGSWDFNNLLPILNKKLQESNASYFFLRWLSVSREAAEDAITSIYELSSDYENKDAQISHILYRLALNHTGISHTYPGLVADAYKAFGDVLHPKINTMTSHEVLPDFTHISKAFESSEELEILAKLNSILLLDGIAIEQNEIIPGNVYQIMDDNSPALIKQEERVKLSKKKPVGKDYEKYSDYPCTPIAIELTPPCDFSHKKVLSRVIGGYIVDFSANEKENKSIENKENGYVLTPICVPGDKGIKYIIFDFRHLFSPTEDQLKDPKQYKVLFRVNPSLFSDLIQKFSSHAARLGLNSLGIDKSIWE